MVNTNKYIKISILYIHEYTKTLQYGSKIQNTLAKLVYCGQFFYFGIFNLRWFIQISKSIPYTATTKSRDHAN